MVLGGQRACLGWDSRPSDVAALSRQPFPSLPFKPRSTLLHPYVFDSQVSMNALRLEKSHRNCRVDPNSFVAPKLSLLIDR